MKESWLQFLRPKCNAGNPKLLSPLLTVENRHITLMAHTKKFNLWMKLKMQMRKDETKVSIPHEGFESMQYSKPWSWSIGGWLISSAFGAAMIPLQLYFCLQTSMLMKENLERMRVRKVDRKLESLVYSVHWEGDLVNVWSWKREKKGQ